MIVTVDIGNSNTVIGLLNDDKKPIFTGRIRSDKRKTKEEFMIELKMLLDIYHVSLEGVEGVIISSVVPGLTDVIKEGMKQMTGHTPLVVGHGIRTGIRVVMDNPATVGADLIVDAVAATEEYSGKLIIFDVGTATTCSVVDENRTYMGTIIMPGMKISQDALTERTSQLPYIRFEKPKHLIGKNTVESMQSGLIYGNAAMVDGLIDRIEQEIGSDVTIIATGGMSNIIIPYCRHKITYEPDLLLKGLWYIYYKNRGHNN